MAAPDAYYKVLIRPGYDQEQLAQVTSYIGSIEGLPPPPPPPDLSKGDGSDVMRHKVVKDEQGRVLTTIDCGRYEGESLRGMRHGYGINYGSDGSWYEGEWIEDTKTGYGRFHSRDGDVYEGQWGGDGKTGNGGSRHGWGKYTWSHGDVYELSLIHI